MFESVLGHESEKKILEQDILNDKVSHAYMFYGKDGIGKKKLAIEFAKHILNTDKLDTCVDFTCIEKQEDKKDILVEQIRDKIVNDVYMAPAMSEYKVYIVDDAHKMNISAQNALLKTLEEPPSYVVIILVTNNIKKILSTVISRTTNISFSGLSEEQVSRYIKKELGIELSEKEVKYSEGSLNVAIQIAGQEEENIYRKIEKLNMALKKSDKLALMKEIEKIDMKNQEALNYFAFLLMEAGDYSKVKHIYNAKERMLQNANEDMVKQALCIRLLDKR